MSFNPGSRLDPSQVEDRRGRRGVGGPIIAAGGGGISILFLIVALLLGVNPFSSGDAIEYQPPTGGTSGSLQECRTGADANQRADCRIVGYTNSIQEYWSGDFSRRGWQYAPAHTVLFTDATQGGCGYASEAQGPFYCPNDQRVYLDLAFFQELQQRFGARGGPFAEAYVVAHEYGHHVQNITSLLEAGGSSRGATGGSVRTELQADCLAGVWASHASATGYLQPLSQDDIAQALDAAGAVGDDRLQRRAQGRVTPETWTHGSSQQRQQWFFTGYRAGDIASCDTSGRL